MAENVRKLKRNEVLFKEGDTPQSIFIVQSGKIGLMVERGTNQLEIAALGVSQVIGETALFSNAKHAFTAQALQETKVLEVPLALMKEQFEKAPPGVKLLVKSLVDDVKASRQQAKVAKMETEKAPCPQGVIHKIFTELHLIARHIGKKDEAQPDQVVLAWNALKLYCSRFFGESPQRMRSLIDLLVKLKWAELTFGKNEDDEEEELQSIKLSNVQVYEDFAEFYQYHLFKGSKAEAIYVDPLALKVAKALFELSAVAEVDHKGASKLEFGAVLNECKTKYRFDLKNTHLDALERKGLFIKRQSFDDGRVVLSFDRKEFGKMAQFWSIIHEIDKWNEKGSVDLNEKEEVQATGNACPQCQTRLEEKHKFCPNCGHKLAA